MPPPKGYVVPNRPKGRKKGQKNRITVVLKDAIMEAFSRAGGVEYLLRQAEHNPVAFMALCARVLPLQVSPDASDSAVLVKRIVHMHQVESPPLVSTTRADLPADPGVVSNVTSVPSTVEVESASIGAGEDQSLTRTKRVN